MISPLSPRLLNVSIKTLAATSAAAFGSFAVVPPGGASEPVPVYTAHEACQQVDTFQTAVGDDPLTTLSIPDGPGPVVEAFVTWIGTDDTTSTTTTDLARADSTLEINGVDVDGLLAPTEAGDKRRDDDYWYAWSANIGPSGLNLLTKSEAHDLTIRGWDVAHDDAHYGRDRAEITIVYDVTPCAQKVDIRLLSGADWISEGWGKPASSVLTLPVESADKPRTETLRLISWGVENRTDRCRASSLWAATGNEVKNLFSTSPQQPAQGLNDAVELISNPFRGEHSPCELTLNPSPDAPYADGHLYPGGATEAPYRAEAARTLPQTQGAELRSVELDIRIPAATSWINLQLESESELFGESGAWTANFVPASSKLLKAPIAELATQPGPSVALASLGDFIWLDDNRDGQQDPSEQGLSEARARLRHDSGQIVAETVTDADGSYLFDGLAPGSYKVEFLVPEAYLKTAAFQSPYVYHESDNSAQDLEETAMTDRATIMPTSLVETDWVELETGEKNFTLDFGVVPELLTPTASIDAKRLSVAASSLGQPTSPQQTPRSNPTASSKQPTSPKQESGLDQATVLAQTTNTANGVISVRGRRVERLAVTGSPTSGFTLVGGGAVLTGSAMLLGAQRRKPVLSC